MELCRLAQPFFMFLMDLEMLIARLELDKTVTVIQDVDFMKTFLHGLLNKLQDIFFGQVPVFQMHVAVRQIVLFYLSDPDSQYTVFPLPL